MNLNFLDFEQPIAELEAKIEELRLVTADSKLNINDEIKKLQEKSQHLTRTIFSKLTPWQKVQLARHPNRPYTWDYINMICDEFDELEGDRHVSCGPAIVAGLGRIEGKPVMIIGHQKGRKTKEKLRRNFGMPRPEEYQKALRLMKLAEKFEIPVLCLIDTAGAYPGIGAEERNQSEAIARNLFEMAKLKTPIICTVIGEGGSGGALAIGVGDKVFMLQYSIYSVISPEGCATILWKTAEKASLAAEAMGVTADRVLDLGLIDRIIEEPLGGAHRNAETMAADLKKTLLDAIVELEKIDTKRMLDLRYQRLLSFGNVK